MERSKVSRIRRRKFENQLNIWFGGLLSLRRDKQESENVLDFNGKSGYQLYWTVSIFPCTVVSKTTARVLTCRMLQWECEIFSHSVSVYLTWGFVICAPLCLHTIGTKRRPQIRPLSLIFYQYDPWTENRLNLRWTWVYCVVAKYFWTVCRTLFLYCRHCP
jgi:hypothetical protein